VVGIDQTKAEIDIANKRFRIPGRVEFEVRGRGTQDLRRARGRDAEREGELWHESRGVDFGI
jgi:hypothetical protein